VQRKYSIKPIRIKPILIRIAKAAGGAPLGGGAAPRRQATRTRQAVGSDQIGFVTPNNRRVFQMKKRELQSVYNVIAAEGRFVTLSSSFAVFVIIFYQVENVALYKKCLRSVLVRLCLVEVVEVQVVGLVP